MRFDPVPILTREEALIHFKAEILDKYEAEHRDEYIKNFEQHYNLLLLTRLLID